MASMYSRFGTDSAAHIRNLILGATSKKDEPVAEGIMSRSIQPSQEVTSRFSGVSGPSPVLRPTADASATNRGQSFIESFATALGMASDDPERVADAVLPREGNGEVDLSGWESLPPPPGRDVVREAFGQTSQGATRVGGASDVFNMQTALDEIIESEAAFSNSEKTEVTMLMAD